MSQHKISTPPPLFSGARKPEWESLPLRSAVPNSAPFPSKPRPILMYRAQRKNASKRDSNAATFHRNKKICGRKNNFQTARRFLAIRSHTPAFSLQISAKKMRRRNKEYPPARRQKTPRATKARRRPANAVGARNVKKIRPLNKRRKRRKNAREKRKRFFPAPRRGAAAADRESAACRWE